jgi:hypothetical protein
MDYSGNYAGTNYDGTFWGFYNSDTAYYYDRDTGICKQIPLDGSLMDPEIPSDSTLVCTFVDPNCISTTNYLQQPALLDPKIYTWVPDSEDGVYTLIDVTEGTCFPVSITQVNTTSGNVPSSVENFWNVVPDVPPFVFDLPTECGDSKISVSERTL